MLRHILTVIGGLVVVGFGVLQAIPYGRGHTNPPVQQEPQWDSPQTRQLVVRACYDCHSNQTVWPWYSYIAPVSWLVYKDVMEGRAKLNFSEMPQKEAHEAAESVQKGSMPPRIYTLIQSKARLSAAEKQALVAGLRATLGGKETQKGEEAKEAEEAVEGAEEYEED
ncbi:MAG: heme-binding domain-containing protein [Dehalococcoidia bacterium]